MKRIQVEKGGEVARIRSDYGGEFGILDLKDIAITMEFTTIMLHGKNVPRDLWAEVVSTACYIINKVYLRTVMNKTTYELWHEKKPNIRYFKIFCNKCYIVLMLKVPLFDP